MSSVRDQVISEFLEIYLEDDQLWAAGGAAEIQQLLATNVDDRGRLNGKVLLNHLVTNGVPMSAARAAMDRFVAKRRASLGGGAASGGATSPPGVARASDAPRTSSAPRPSPDAERLNVRRPHAGGIGVVSASRVAAELSDPRMAAPSSRSGQLPWGSPPSAAAAAQAEAVPPGVPPLPGGPAAPSVPPLPGGAPRASAEPPTALLDLEELPADALSAVADEFEDEATDVSEAFTGTDDVVDTPTPVSGSVTPAPRAATELRGGTPRIADISLDEMHLDGDGDNEFDAPTVAMTAAEMGIATVDDPPPAAHTLSTPSIKALPVDTEPPPMLLDPSALTEVVAAPASPTPAPPTPAMPAAPRKRSATEIRGAPIAASASVRSTTPRPTGPPSALNAGAPAGPPSALSTPPSALGETSGKKRRASKSDDVLSGAMADALGITKRQEDAKEVAKQEAIKADPTLGRTERNPEDERGPVHPGVFLSVAGVVAAVVGMVLSGQPQPAMVAFTPPQTALPCALPTAAGGELFCVVPLAATQLPTEQLRLKLDRSREAATKAGYKGLWFKLAETGRVWTPPYGSWTLQQAPVTTPAQAAPDKQLPSKEAQAVDDILEGLAPSAQAPAEDDDEDDDGRGDDTVDEAKKAPAKSPGRTKRTRRKSKPKKQPKKAADD